MAISKEAIERIVNFHPGERDEKLANQGIYAVSLSNEPLVLGWTKQPTLALVNGSRIITLAYAADVRNLGESLATAVVNHLYPVSDWPEDY